MTHEAGVIGSAKPARPQLLARLLRIWLCFTAFITVAAPPLLMPKAGLDESWMWGLNEALAQGLTFGQDVIFNVGPYVSLFSQHYHPGIEGLAIGARLYLGLCYALALFLATRRASLLWILCLALFIPSAMSRRDVLLALYPLILAIGLTNHLRETQLPSASKGTDTTLLALLFSALGLLPLIKGSFLIGAVATAGLSMLLLLQAGRKLLGALVLLAPLAGLVGFWLLAGQRLAALPDYFITMASVVTGYSEAMALPGNSAEIVLYLLACLGILYAVASAPELPRIHRLFLALLFALFLFVMFKNGFVRHDKHALIAGSAALLGLAAAGLFVTGRPATLGLTFVLSLATMIFIDQNHTSSKSTYVHDNFTVTYLDAIQGFASLFDKSGALAAAYEKERDNIRNELPLPNLAGTTDIYSYGQSYLLASGNRWSPRPIIQGHEAYTPKLEALNAAFLTSQHAPDHILFKVETIDDRMPSYEDGPSWPLLMAGYVPYRFESGYLFLHKADPKIPAAQLLQASPQKLKARVELPASQEPLFAKVKIQPTLMGRLLSLLYKPDQLFISVDLADGSTRRFRLPSALGEAGFMVSPLIETTPEFAFLFSDRSYLASKEVRAIEITAASDTTLFWQETYTLALERPAITPASELSLASVFDASTGVTEPIDETDCEGNIESMNGQRLGAAFSLFGRTLAVSGWTTKDGKAGKLPEAVLIGLTGEDNQTHVFATRPVPRDDLVAFFKSPDVRMAGFTAFADISDFKGQYRLRLVHKNQGLLQACRQQQQSMALNAPLPVAAPLSDTPKPEVHEEARRFDEKITLPDTLAAETLVCEGNIDRLDGKPFANAPVEAKGSLILDGWMTISGAEGTVPQKVIISLTDATGAVETILAQKTQRGDINAHFNKPDMPDAGFKAAIDLSRLKGDYTLGLARLDHDTLQKCSQFSVPLKISQ